MVRGGAVWCLPRNERLMAGSLGYRRWAYAAYGALRGDGHFAVPAFSVPLPHPERERIPRRRAAAQSSDIHFFIEPLPALLNGKILTYHFTEVKETGRLRRVILQRRPVSCAILFQFSDKVQNVHGNAEIDEKGNGVHNCGNERARHNGRVQFQLVGKDWQK